MFTAQELQWLLGALDRIDFKGAEAQSVVIMQQKTRALLKEFAEKSLEKEKEPKKK